MRERTRQETLTRRQSKVNQSMGDEGLKQLTKWLPCPERIATQWGQVTRAEWCRLECARIESSNEHRARAAIVDGCVAIFSWTSRALVRSQGRTAV